MKIAADQKKQTLVAIALAVFIVAFAGGTTVYRSRAQAAEDRENLRKQRAAAGMRSPQDMGQIMLDAQARELGLNEDQKKAFGDKQRSIFESVGPIFSDSALSQEQKRQKATEIWTKGQEDLKRSLTPDQAAKYDAMNARMAQQFNGRRANGAPSQNRP